MSNTGPPTIPTRSSSLKRPRSSSLRRAALDDEELSITVEHEKILVQLSQQRKKLRPSSSFDSTFWAENASFLDLDSTRASLYSSLQFVKYQQAGGQLSRERWEETDETGRSLLLQSMALKKQADLANKQAVKQTPLQRSYSAFVKLFNSSKLGFNISKAGNKGRRGTSDQSSMRSAMIQAYSPDTGSENQAGIWDPLLEQSVDSGIVVAAHLFPWRSADSMEAIFGPGTRQELFSPLNGLFLHKQIERALDKGYLVFVPDVWEEPQNPQAPWEDIAVRNEALKKWEASHPREYRVLVLDSEPEIMRKNIFGGLYGDKFSTMNDLNGKRLVFKTDARPRARYVWWAFLNAITQLTWHGQGLATTSSPLQKEVFKGTRYWGTHGRYVKKNMLLGFVQELGHSVDDSIAESIMEHAIEDNDDDLEPDPSLVAVVADNAVRRTQKEDGYDYEAEVAYQEAGYRDDMAEILGRL